MTKKTLNHTLQLAVPNANSNNKAECEGVVSDIKKAWANVNNVQEKFVVVDILSCEAYPGKSRFLASAKYNYDSKMKSNEEIEQGLQTRLVGTDLDSIPILICSGNCDASKFNTGSTEKPESSNTLIIILIILIVLVVVVLSFCGYNKWVAKQIADERKLTVYRQQTNTAQTPRKPWVATSL